MRTFYPFTFDSIGKNHRYVYHIQGGSSMLSLTDATWKNWSQTVMSKPEAYHFPKTLEDMKQLVDDCRTTGKKIRVVGAGHSFTPLVATSEVLISLEHFTGL